MPETVLKTTNLKAFYGDFQALFGIDFEIAMGETVAIIGANGAGKSTFLRTITGMLASGSKKADIEFLGRPVGGLPPHELVVCGMAMVPEGRRIFPSLTVEENLLAGAYARKGGNWDLDRVYELFPVLKERRHHGGIELSGGQLQMVAIGRALMSSPRLLLCDEVSLGLAPIIVRVIYQAIERIKAQGTTVVVVEQDINTALSVADRIYCFQEGRVSLTGRPGEVTREEISAAYFGLDKTEGAA
ncbi:ABC transporter ATP-binding protein [Sinorhizobium meliloti]|uniref:ABC transporter ATP-binding protein n=1 Tax=Rhizobium meliloti TaxID=382 RepID=UPI003F144AB3